MNIDPQIAAVEAAQGSLAIELQLLGEAFIQPDGKPVAGQHGRTPAQ